MPVTMENKKIFYVGGAAPATDDYNDLENKPAIDGVVLTSTTTKGDLDLDTIFQYRGQVDTYDELPSSGMSIGDTYNVADTGENYAWNGTSWDCLTGTDVVNYVDGQLEALNQPITIDALKNNISHLKTINGNNIIGDGDIVITTNYSFDPSWTTNLTTNDFLADVYADEDAIPGMTYLGELTCSDLPTGLVNAEAFVEIMPTATSAPKVIHVVITSGNLSPYRWELTYWVTSGDVIHNSGWIAFQPLITSTNKLNSDYVDDTNHTNKFVTASEKTTWSGKQDALVSGTNIKTINNNSILGSGDITIDSLPSQTGNAGKFLTTDGTDASWAVVPDALPNQVGNAGKALYTDGQDASWKVTRDPNTYRSLSAAQQATLLSNGTYNGEDVTSGEIFTSADGSFKEFDDDVTYGGDKQLSFTMPYNPIELSSQCSFDFGSGNKGVVFVARLGEYSTGMFCIKEETMDSQQFLGYSKPKLFNDGSKIYRITTNSVYRATTDGTTWGNEVGFSSGLVQGQLERAGYFNALGKVLIFVYKGSYGGQDLAYAYSDSMDTAFTAGTFPTGFNVEDTCQVVVFSDEVRMFDLTTGKIYSTTDFSQGWTDTGVTATFPSATTFEVLGGTLLAYSSAYPNTGNVYYSTDRGETWTLTNLPTNIRCSIAYVEDSQTWVAVNVGNTSTYYTSINGYQYSEQTPQTGTTIYADLLGGTDSAYTISTSGSSRIFTGAQHDRSLTNLSYNKTDVDTALSAKAEDSAVVHKTGNEEIQGVKTFKAGSTANTLTVDNPSGSPAIRFKQGSTDFSYIGVPDGNRIGQLTGGDSPSWSKSIVRSNWNATTGSTTEPVYIDSNGVATPITSYSGNAAGLTNLTATIAELNYCDGVTSNIQTQLDGLASKTAVVVLESTDSITLADNTVYNGGTQTSLTIALPSVNTIGFTSEVDFTSGSTATTLTFSGAINWRGDDIQKVNNQWVFIPEINKRYTVMFWYDGVNYNGLVTGV